jgi:hypothetical protein
MVLADEVTEFAMKLGTKLVTIRLPAEGDGPAWTTQRMVPVSAGQTYVFMGNPAPTAPEAGLAWA